MPINITNLETVINAKITAATSATEVKELLLISKSIDALETGTSLKSSDIGVSIQAFDSTIMVDSDIGVSVEAFDATILKDADIGVNVQGFDSTIMVDADIGVSVEAYDATILKDADIGVNLEAFDATILKDADIGVNVEAFDATILKDADIGVNLEAYDADTSKTDVAESRTANINLHTYTEKYVTISTNGIIDLSLGSVFIHTHGGSMSTFTLSNVPSSGVSGFILILVNGGSYALTWPASFKWAAATPPVLTAAGTDIFTFTTNDFGTTWFGIASGIGMG